MKSDKLRAVLALEDGSVWDGRGFGAPAIVELEEKISRHRLGQIPLRLLEEAKQKGFSVTDSISTNLQIAELFV